MPSEKRVLRVHGVAGRLLSETRDCLEAIEHAYNSLYALETTIDSLVRYLRNLEDLFSLPRRLLVPLGLGFPFPPILGRPHVPQVSWPPSPSQLASMVLPADRLVFRGAQFESPGFWDIIGTLNPFETLRLYLNDRHERRRDKDFRNEQVRRKFNQEERAREAHLQWMEDSALIRRIEEARRLGATERDIAPLLNELLHRPLRNVAHYQDGGLVEHAELQELPQSDDEK